MPQWHPPTPGVSSDPQDPTHLPENAQAPSPVRLIRYRFVGSPRAENALPGSLSQVVVDAIAQETAPLSESNLTNDSGSVGRESDDPALPDRQPQGFLREVYARPDQALMAPSQKRDPTAEFPHALQRLSPSREEFRAAAANSASPHVTVDHVPEIDRLEFRYFDGQRWHTSWDSSISGALPVAVEMTFELALPQQPVRPTRPARQSDRVAGTTLPANTRQHIPPSGSVNLAEASHALNGAAFRSLAVLRAPLRTPPSPVDMEVTR